MNKKIVVLGILKEVRIDENRTPFSPGQVSNILNKFSNIDWILWILIEKIIPKILNSHRPELVIYQAGADPFSGDQLGSLKITKKGLQKRDELVIESCKKLSIPIAGTLGGGYAEDPEDTVDIHLQTSLSFINA